MASKEKEQHHDLFKHLCDLSRGLVVRICLLNGCLAMLDVPTLTTRYNEGCILLTSAIGEELLNLADRYKVRSFLLLIFLVCQIT